MRIFSYRNKRIIKTTLLILAALLGLFLLFFICRMIYIQRYLVFSDDGSVSLDYEQQLEDTGLEETPLNPDDFPVEIVVPDKDTVVSGPVDDSPKQLSGWYISTDMLRNFEAVQTGLAELETPPKTLLFEMKSIFGYYYYDSDLYSDYTANANVEAIEALIAQLDKEDVYLIAKVPAFTDPNFALDNQSCGLALSFGALWMDDLGCYWLDPMDEDVLNFLSAIATELQALGFDEVVFDNYLIPDNERIVYPEEFTREEYAAQSAQLLKDSLSDLSIRVSFGSPSPLMASMGTRLYLSGVEGSAVAETAQPLLEQLEDPAAQLVFLTPSRDTRFEEYSVLRPLIDSEEE